jgi:fatty acid synthase subunit beta
MTDPAITALIDICATEAEHKTMPIVLQRGVATIPLAGIDVPFHSTHLRPGVQMFRNFLMENITADRIQAEKLVGRYLPNLIAKPFEISKDYVAEVYELTGSSELKNILEEVDMLYCR